MQQPCGDCRDVEREMHGERLEHGRIGWRKLTELFEAWEGLQRPEAWVIEVERRVT